MDEFEDAPSEGYDGSGDLAESLVLDTRQLAALSTADLLAVAGGQKGLVRLLETNQLVIAARYAETHRDPAGAPGRHSEQVRQVQLAGDGSSLVSEYAALALGHALGTTADSATVLMAHALELRDRLPHLWARVIAGEVEAWRARQVAAVTMSESPEVLALVDEDLATTKRAIHTPTAQDAVLTAVAHLDAAEAERREAVRADKRGVHLDRERLTGLPARWTDLHARLDTPDAEALDATLDRLADVLERNAVAEAPHDPDLALAHRHWRARALGLLADPHLAAEVLDSAATGEQVDTRRGTAVLYAHVRVDADGQLSPTVDLERYGTTTLDQAKTWLDDRTKVTVRPVLDPDRIDAVDGHDPTEAMREIVMGRDKTCVFPGCEVDARNTDIDHIEPYVSPDDGGPPGQTRPENLACLCRRHHRLKTHAGWTYRRVGDRYVWDPPARAA